MKTFICIKSPIPELLVVLCPGAFLLLSKGVENLDSSDFARACCSLKDGLEDRFLVALESLLASSEVSLLKLALLTCASSGENVGASA